MTIDDANLKQEMFLPRLPGWQPLLSVMKLLLVTAVFGGGFVWLLSWFAQVDVYHSHFFDHGAILKRYNLCRVLFIASLAWLIYFPGGAVLAAAGGGVFLRGVSTAERYLVGFLAGAGVWHAVLFIIGLAGGYRRPVAVALVLIVLALSMPHLLYCIEEAARNLWPGRRGLRGDRKWVLLLGLLLAAVAFVFIAVKGLYPAGGHDYYIHYFYYYVSVIRRGSTMPNEIWYHFYYSKGAGLYFLSMLLTDPLAPQLVTTVFIGNGALAVFVLVRRAAPGKLVPWVGAILYLAFLIYTPGPDLNRREGGWGDLEKLHELTAVMLLGILWICNRMSFAAGRERWAWLAALALAVAATVLITTVMAVIIGAFLALLAVWWACRRQWPRAAMALAGAASAGFTLVAVLTVNYVLTGLPLDQFLLESWDFADVEKISRWGVLEGVLIQHWSLTGYGANEVPLSTAVLPLVFNYLRLGIWWPLALMGGVAVTWAVCRRRLRAALAVPEYAAAVRTLVLFVGLFCLMATFLGSARQQVSSFFRFSSFMYAPVLCLCLLPCALLPRWKRWRIVFMVAALVAVVGGQHLFKKGLVPRSVAERPDYIYLMQRGADLQSILVNARNLLEGRYSLKDAYQNQQGWPGRMPYGGIYPPMEKVREVVGPGTPVYTMHIHSYSMLPDFDLRISTIARIPMDVVLLGTADEARAALEAEGINYFFVSKELLIYSPLPLSPLFAPETIGQHLGVKWTDGTSYLLTWAGPDTQPLDAAFLARYAEQIRESPTMQTYPAEELKQVFTRFRAEGLKPFRLPWYHRGWSKR